MRLTKSKGTKEATAPDYVVVDRDRLSNLVLEVNLMISSGYVPIGGITYTPGGMFYQALLKGPGSVK